MLRGMISAPGHELRDQPHPDHAVVKMFESIIHADPVLPMTHLKQTTVSRINMFAIFRLLFHGLGVVQVINTSLVHVTCCCEDLQRPSFRATRSQ